MVYGERISIKTRRESQLMREAGRHLAEILLEMREAARPGVATAEFDEYAARAIKDRGLGSSFLGYAPGGMPPYPAMVCVSVNEQVVHGIPGSRALEEGDLLSLDFGVSLDGFHADSAVTVPIGPISPRAQKLLDVTHDSLYRGIEQMVPGNRLSDIGHAVQMRAEGEGFTVVRAFAGHGIGTQMHEPPWIANFGPPGKGPRLRSGMVFAIEPMVNAGGPEVKVLDDEWTAITADGQLSAHFEHTVLVTEKGPDVLTRIPGSH